MEWKIPLADVDIGAEEREAVDQVLASGWLTMGSITQEFEAEFAQHLGVKHAIAVTNGTAALHLACLAAGLQPGDEVILPAFTFVATAAAVRYAGAIPVFADIQGEKDFNVSPASIERHITPKTRAILVVHYGGYACDMPAIMQIAKKHGLVVLEDAAHAVGAQLQGRSLGAWGLVGSFSFFSNKNLTTGEGGMLVCEDDGVADLLRSLRSHGMTTLTWDRHRGHAWSYDVTNLGYNYRIDEIRSAIGRVQLAKLDSNNELRRSLTTYYRQLFEQAVPELTIPFSAHPGLSACHILPILLPQGVNRKAFMDAMKADGIQTSIHYPPIHHFLEYKQLETAYPRSLENTESIAARQVTLPLYPALRPSDIEVVVEAVRSAVQNI
ncbi:MAG: DegT/DnrJ/EryC1/StrS aminotransferase family protein [Anaerolineae bacterium]|nr:DegT/DnrJ/EryC1/StrS aminotransferase family protein [Anaerolineae bacterium]